jgi:hypothetical protein
MNDTIAGLPVADVASNTIHKGPRIHPDTIDLPPTVTASPDSPAALQNA